MDVVIILFLLVNDMIGMIGKCQFEWFDLIKINCNGITQHLTLRQPLNPHQKQECLSPGT